MKTKTFINNTENKPYPASKRKAIRATAKKRRRRVDVDLTVMRFINIFRGVEGKDGNEWIQKKY